MDARELIETELVNLGRRQVRRRMMPQRILVKSIAVRVLADANLLRRTRQQLRWLALMPGWSAIFSTRFV